MLYGLLSKLSVPGNVNSLNNYAEAPEITCRKEVQERSMVVPTGANISPKGSGAGRNRRGRGR